jgi:hypothetical protein
MHPGTKRLVVAFIALGASLPLVGCGTPPPRPPKTQGELALAAQPVSDAKFPEAVRDLLMAEPGSAERKARLAGVLARQMSRAASRFDERMPDEGTTAVRGALSLVRTGELVDGAFGSDGGKALRGAAAEYAKRGDDGRARAIYELLVRVLPEKDRADARDHLDAIKVWTRDTAKGGAMQAAGSLETAAMARRMLEPSVDAREEAAARTSAWVAQAFEVRRIFRERRVQPDRDEAVEALRALGTGATVLAAVHLRDADAKSALAAIEKADARDIARPDVLQALERVTDKADAEAWVALTRALRAPSRDGEDAPQDLELLRTITFTIATEAYRLDQEVPETAGIVAEALVELGMPDAAPTVLVAAVRAHPEPQIVSGAMQLTLLALLRAAKLDDLAAARRVFEAAGPLFAVADDPKLGRRTRPSAATVRAAMGELEIRAGYLTRGEALLAAAAKQERSGAVLLALARIAAHEQRIADAKEKVREALVLEDARRDPALRGEAMLFQGDLLRDEGDKEGARQVYKRCLEDLARARAASEGDLRARTERLVARVSDRFDDDAGAERALERALEASARDKAQIAATLGQQVARALLRSDTKAAQGALARAVAAQVPREDLVYYASWTRALERGSRGKPPADGLAEKVLAQAADDPRWIGKVASFGLGKLAGDALLSAARTPAQRTEALFYSGLARRVDGDMKGAETDLRQALKEGGLDLMEVSLARDLLAGNRGAIGGPVPNVGLP